MFEALRCCIGNCCKRGVGLNGHEPAVHMLQANGNNVIVLINRDTANVLYRRRHGILA